MDEKSQGNFQYNPDQEVSDFIDTEQDSDKKQNETDKNRMVNWTGSEFIANHKDKRWFVSFFGALALGVAIIFILTRDYISAISVAIVGVLFAFLANHKPRQLSYMIDNNGINIGPKFYPFEQFKSFSLAQDGAIGYVELLPMKRFMPDVSIYFPPEEADKVVAILSDHLPHHEDGERQIDKLAKKLRF
jgi:hypothetical protein